MVAGVLDQGSWCSSMSVALTPRSGSCVCGYSPKGERLNLSVARNRGKNTTLLANITLEGMGPSLAVGG